MKKPICFVDTETTSLRPDREAWEIAIIRRDPEETADRTLHLMVDVELTEADPFSLRIGRFYERHPVGRYLSGRSVNVKQPLASAEDAAPGAPAFVTPFVTQYVAAQVVARWTHDAHLIGAVPNFDAEVFGELLRRNGLTPAHHYHLIDIESLAVGYLRGLAEAEKRTGILLRSGGPLDESLFELPWKSDDLAAACGVPPTPTEERHTALGDARSVRRWYDHITGRTVTP